MVKRLQTALPNAAVQSYPADVRAYLDTFRAVNGAVLVQFVERERQYISQTAGTQTVTMEVVAISRNLKEHSHVYALLDGAFGALSGVDLTETVSANDPDDPDATIEEPIGVRLYCASEGYETYLEKNGLWVYTQRYKSDPFGFIAEEPEGNIVITEFTLRADGEANTYIPNPHELEETP